ncbi:MAG: nucleotidyltransferase domain-containing protein [Candidatus Thorarchaeota archaeon]|nr:nucleotidyltransferase domain-containing protein [Candidatus Thorarchaeota archaeon]
MNRDKIRRDPHFLSKREVVLFGSQVSGTFDSRSDVDIAIITRSQDKDEMMHIRLDALGKAPDGYDIQIFEELPLVIKGAIIEEFEVLFGDSLEIGMYFFYIRKFWEDYNHRIEVPTIEEIQRGFAEGQNP